MDTFDARYGTETAGTQLIPWYRRLSRTGWDSIRYATVREDKIHALLDPWPREWTVLDLGCGKGRTLMIAGLMGFKIAGVEFQTHLAITARENLHRVGLRESVITGDAATVPWPEGPLVVYLYNPFRGRIMKTVAQRLAARADVVVIYVNPYCADAFADWTPVAFTRAQADLFSPGSVKIWRR